MNAHTDPDALVLTRQDHGPVCVLTMNRSAARNSLSDELLAALSNSIAALTDDRSVRVVILAANGPAYCAGHDLKELTVRRGDADGGLAYYRSIMTRCSAMMQSIIALPQPVIACVQGVATAAGCQLVATCDLAVASSAARFATPGVDIGLFCSTPMVALSRAVSRKHAMEMLLTGEMIDADHAHRIGLVNRVVPAGQEREAALALAGVIAGKSSHVIGLGKRAFYRQIEKPLQQAYDDAAEVMTRNMMARDAQEGIGAFIEKRPPTWQDC